MENEPFSSMMYLLKVIIFHGHGLLPYKLYYL